MKLTPLIAFAAYTTAGLVFASVAGIQSPAEAQSLAEANGAYRAPELSRHGVSLGREVPSTPLTLTVWLNLHDREAMDARVRALYTPGSPTFHHWLTSADLEQYAPTPDEVNAVKAEITANHLLVEAVDPLHLSVRFTGRTEDIERAFGVEIHRYQVNGQMVRATSAVPQLRGQANGLVQHLAGLNSLSPAPALSSAKLGAATQNTALPSPGNTPADTNLQMGSGFTSQCFHFPASEKVTDDRGTTAVFSGLIYGANASTQDNKASACAYTPEQVQQFYGLNTAFQLGYKGSGQTVVLISAYAEPYAQADANAFSALFNLPALSAANFQIYDPYGTEPVSPGLVGGGLLQNTWTQQTDIGVQWSHAAAPGANIALVEAYSDDTEELQAAVLYAVTNHLGNVLAGFFAQSESMEGAPSLAVWNEIIELGAAEGISMNFPSGDVGDYSNPQELYTGNTVSYTFSPTTVSAPADSPYATAVGGTTVALAPAGDVSFTTGWGTGSGAVFISRGGQITPTPLARFQGGSGGGASGYFGKPPYQAGLPGSARLLPDVSALADPATGAEYVFTRSSGAGGDTEQVVGVAGGTGLATAIFSGIWAIADEYTGTSLGQAAPVLALTQGLLVRDVLPIEGPANVTATITSPSGAVSYSPESLVPPLFGQTQFTSALQLYDTYMFGYNYILYSFGTDLSLKLAPGWDDVTGYGTPSLGTALLEIGAKPKQ